MSHRSGKIGYAPVKEEVVTTIEEAGAALDEMEGSMYIDRVETEGNENSFVDDENYVMDRTRRYSVIGDDPSFKQYTKNSGYNNAVKLEQSRKGKGNKRLDRSESFLSVSLKDLALSDNVGTSLGFSTTSEFGLSTIGEVEMDFEESTVVRDQYRVVKKDLLFKVNFQ